MRIAVIAPPWFAVPPTTYGGIELVVALETETLVARGHDVTLYAAPGSRGGARLVTPLGATPPRDALGSIASGHQFYEGAHVAAAYRNAATADVIHDHCGALGAAIGASICGPPVVQTLHGPWTDASRTFYREVDDRIHLVAISDRQRRDNPDVRYAARVYNGIDVTAYPVIEAKGDYLAYIGRAHPEKVPDRTIDLARAAGMPLKMIVKRSEPAEREYWDHVVRPRLGSDIEVLEGVDHAAKVEVLGHARALLFPIRWPEPFGLVLAEALACGTPVVTCPAGAAPEIVVDGVTGCIGRTDQELGVGLQRAWDGAYPAAACRARVEEHFSATAMAAGYECVFTRILAGTTLGARGEHGAA